MLAEYDRRRRLIVDGLNALGLETFEPRGAFYAFPRITSTGLDDETFVERLLTEEHVAVVPGSAFGPSGAGHVRMCYATSYERLEEALRRIGRFVERRPGGLMHPMRLVGGRPIAIHDIGEGTPVLFLHGFGPDHRSLLHGLGSVFERRPGYRRLHVDLPGFGSSPGDPEIDGSEAMVDVVLELIDEVIGDESFLLVGESWGGYLARAVVAKRREQVRGVALVVTVVIATHADRDVSPSPILFEEPNILDGVGLADAAAIREMAVIIDRAAWDYIATAIMPAGRRRGPSGRRPDQRAVRVLRRRRRHRRAIRPTQSDRGRPAGLGRRLPGRVRLIERFPRSTFAVLDAAGHDLEGERPMLLAALVDDWLDRVELGASAG